MVVTSSPVSCRSALTAPALNYSVSAPPLQLRSIPPPFCSPSVAAACLRVLDKTSAEEENGEEGGGGVARAHNRLPGGSTWQQEFHMNANGIFSIPTEIADRFSERIDPISHGVYIW